MELNKKNLGFGSLRLPWKNGKLDIETIIEMIDEYQKESFCYYDVHPHYLAGKAEEIIKRLVV